MLNRKKLKQTAHSMPEAKDFPLKASAANAARAARLQRQQHKQPHIVHAESSSSYCTDGDGGLDLSSRCHPRKRSSSSAHSPFAGSDIEADLMFHSLDSVHSSTTAMLNFLSGGPGTGRHAVGGGVMGGVCDDVHHDDTSGSEFDGHDSFASLGADDDDEEEVYREHRNIMARQMFEASIVSPISRQRPTVGSACGPTPASVGLLHHQHQHHPKGVQSSTRRLTKDQSFRGGLDLIAE